MTLDKHRIAQIVRETLEEEKNTLWGNIRKRRRAGKRRLRPGDKNYPKTLDIDEIERVVEGIIDGLSGSTKAAPVPPDVKAAVRQRDIDNAKKSGDTAAKKLTPAVGPKKTEIDKMSVGDVKKMVKDFGKDKETPDKEDAKKAAAAVLDLSTRDAQGSTDMLSAMKSNPKLRAAVNSVPGMTDMQSAVDTKLKADGKDPSTAVGDSWRELGRLTSKYSLSELKAIEAMNEEVDEMLNRRSCRRQ